MPLPTIFPSTALRSSQPAVRKAADHSPVYITDSGGQNYVFCTEAHLDEEERNAEERAAYATRVKRITERGKRTIARERRPEGME